MYESPRSAKGAQMKKELEKRKEEILYQWEFLRDKKITKSSPRHLSEALKLVKAQAKKYGVKLV